MEKFLQLRLLSLSTKDYPSTWEGLQVSVLLKVAMKDYKIFCMWCLDPEDLRYYYWLPSDDLHTEEIRLQDFVTIDYCAFAQFSNYVVRGLVGKRFSFFRTSLYF